MRKAKPGNPYQWSAQNIKVPFLAPDVITKVVPSPVEGWDQISPLAEMDPKRAPILTNWVPRPGYVELRGGYIPWSSTNAGHPAESLMVYRGPTSQQMFAASGGTIYNCSSNSGGTAVVTGLTSDRWQYVNFTPGGGTTVIQLVNGADPLQMYNGTSWTVPSITGFPNSFTTNDIVNIWSDKQRLWYTMVNSTIVVYMPTDAIMGPIESYQDFGLLWNKGGYAVGVGTWTIDGGNGPQAYTVFLSSQGQCTVYAGTDPTNTAAWSLVGTFNLPPPIGTRCMMPIGSDLAIITQQGVLPLSQALPFDPSADRSVSITTRIQNAMAQASLNYGSNFGWELAVYPNQQLLLVNVPLGTNTQQQQFVMNTLTGAWSLFSGWNANTFALYNNNLYFADNNGYVNQAYMGSADFLTSIPADMQCAFNWFDDPGRVKRMTMIQPLLNVSSGITPTLAIDADFSTSTAVAPVSGVTGSTLWDSAIWDESDWPTTSVTSIMWLSTEVIGHALAVHMRANITGVSNALALGIFDTGEFNIAEFDETVTTAIPVLQVNAFNSILEMGGAI